MIGLTTSTKNAVKPYRSSVQPNIYALNLNDLEQSALIGDDGWLALAVNMAGCLRGGTVL